MKTKSILTVCLTLCLGAGVASAKGGKKGHGSKIDTNGDGLVSLAEFSAKCKKPEKASKIFEKADANHDGQLDKTEIESAKKGKKGGGKKRKGKK